VPALAHVVLTLGLCAGSPAPSAPATTLHVRLEDRVTRVLVDRTVTVEPVQREYTLQFDAPAGVYRVHAGTAEPQCDTTTYLYFLSGYERHISVPLHAATPRSNRPLYLLAGAIPDSAAYVRPAPFLFAQSAQCDEPAGAPSPVRAETEYDPGSFYTTLYATPGTPLASQLLTLNIQAPAGTDHYVYIPMPFPIPEPKDGWPVALRVDIPSALIATLGPASASWFVCPHLRISSSR
jgi:hypothetical protein